MPIDDASMDSMDHPHRTPFWNWTGIYENGSESFGIAPYAAVAGY